MIFDAPPPAIILPGEPWQRRLNRDLCAKGVPIGIRQAIVRELSRVIDRPKVLKPTLADLEAFAGIALASMVPGMAAVAMDATSPQESGAFPVVETVNYGFNSSTATSHSVNLPSGIEAGNLLVFAISAARRNASNSRVSADFSTPSGWTELFQDINPSNNNDVRLGVYCKIASGSEGGTVSISTANSSRTAHVSFRISGAHGDISATTANGNDGSSPSSPGHSPSWGSAKNLWIFAGGYSPQSLATNGTGSLNIPTGFAGYYGANNSGNNNGCATIMSWLQLEAGTLTPGSSGVATTTDYVVATIAVRPAA